MSLRSSKLLLYMIYKLKIILIQKKKLVWFRNLEQEFREKLSALRSEAEQENEVLLQQVEKERDKLKEEVELLKSQEANLQEEAITAVKVNKDYS